MRGSCYCVVFSWILLVSSVNVVHIGNLESCLFVSEIVSTSKCSLCLFLIRVLKVFDLQYESAKMYTYIKY